MKNQSEYIEMIIVRLRDVEFEIRELEILAEKAAEEIRAEYQNQINDLFLKKEELKEKVTIIQKATGNAWEDMKAGTQLGWEAFNEAIKKK